MAGILTLNDRHDAFERFYAPVFCDFIRNYFLSDSKTFGLLDTSFSYCNIAWASTYYTRLTVLETLQKRAIRIICNTSYRAHTKPLFKYLNILPFECINKLQIGIFMYKLHSNLILASFGHWF